jgi:hypothetical protein
LKLNDFKTMRFSANYKRVVKKWIKSYVPNICSLIKLLLRRTLVLRVILFSGVYCIKFWLFEFLSVLSSRVTPLNLKHLDVIPFATLYQLACLNIFQLFILYSHISAALYGIRIQIRYKFFDTLLRKCCQH